MNPPSWMSGPPPRILLATDLSARCDRALDRAAQLTGQWHAELIALNVLESVPAAPDRTLNAIYDDGGASSEQIALRQLSQDLAGLGVLPSVRIARGNAPDAIRDAATGEHCDLIVTGMARNEIFGRFLLGTTVEKLARMVYQPLLVVRRRPHGPYRKVVVATDFSEPSRHALHAATRFFPNSELIVYHACNMPLSGVTDDVSGERACTDAARDAGEDFLAGSDLLDVTRHHLRLVVEYGALETTLTHYVRQHDVDLVVMGTHGRSGLLTTLLGSTVTRLLDWLPCDTMIVRDPNARV